MKEITKKEALFLLENLNETDILTLAANVIDENLVDITGEIDTINNSHDVDLWVDKLSGNPKSYAMLAMGIAVRNPLFSIDVKYSGIDIRQYIRDNQGNLQTIGSLYITYAEKVGEMYVKS